MARTPFQVLVIPFRHSRTPALEYAILRRSDSGDWQFIAGGGEEGESPAEAARREAREEAGVPTESVLIPLEAQATIWYCQLDATGATLGHRVSGIAQAVVAAFQSLKERSRNSR